MNNNKPVFQQIMEMVENDILSDVYKTDDMIISTTQISKLLNVNPTTSVKAISKLSDEGILYKKRGLGMCVTENAKKLIQSRRKESFINELIPEIVEESGRLGISYNELMGLIRRVSND